MLQKLWLTTAVLTDYTWVARTPWEFHYGPSRESRCMETAIVVCNTGANVLHLVMPVSFGLCSQRRTCHSCGWMCFMELCLGSDVYIMTLCICI